MSLVIRKMVVTAAEAGVSAGAEALEGTTAAGTVGRAARPPLVLVAGRMVDSACCEALLVEGTGRVGCAGGGAGAVRAPWFAMFLRAPPLRLFLKTCCAVLSVWYAASMVSCASSSLTTGKEIILVGFDGCGCKGNELGSHLRKTKTLAKQGES